MICFDIWYSFLLNLIIRVFNVFKGCKIFRIEGKGSRNMMSEEVLEY